MEALDHLRTLIAALDEVLVDALCARAPLGFDESLYAMPEDPAPALHAMAAAFAEAATLAGRTRVLRPGYLRLLLPALCEPSRKDAPAFSTLAADAACLDALARRLALSVHVATRKREAIPAALLDAIESGNPRRVESAITNSAVEDDVLARVRSRAAGQSECSGLPNRLAALYAEWIIPLSRKIQVHGLLAQSRSTPAPEGEKAAGS